MHLSSRETSSSRSGHAAASFRAEECKTGAGFGEAEVSFEAGNGLSRQL